MQIIYGQTRPAHKGRRQWRNARLFAGVEPKATAVFLDGDYPRVRKAYEAAGVPVHQDEPDPTDHDGDGVMSGSAERTSETKAEIMADLDAANIAYDPKAKKAELAALRDAE